MYVIELVHTKLNLQALIYKNKTLKSEYNSWVIKIINEQVFFSFATRTSKKIKRL